MLIYGKTPKDWKELIGVQSLYYRREIVMFTLGFIIGVIVGWVDIM